MTLISVIVPVYKVELYLRECLDSIINQTYKNLEIILIDDGSPDNSPAICDEYALKDERIIVIHQKNGGLSAARNAGLDIAKGDYICFVDSDDFIHPQYCEILYNGIMGTTNLFSSCDVYNFFSNDYTFPSFDTRNISYSAHSFEYFLSHIETGVWNKLYCSDIFKNIRFLNGKIHEDMLFWSDFFKAFNGDYVKVNESLYYYRQRRDSITGQNKCHIDRIFAGEMLFNTVKNLFPDHSVFYFEYAVGHPWSTVDAIYVSFSFFDNIKFLKNLKAFLKKNRNIISESKRFSNVVKRRMILFSHSIFLYMLNAYTRLARVYLFRIFKKDPYKSEHGI